MKAIAAMDPNRVIGHKGRLPWHFPDDFKWFKKATSVGSGLVMGRSTFDSLGGPLPNRFVYILTRDPEKLLLPSYESCKYVSVTWLFNQPSEWKDQLWICGGASVYKLFLPLCKEIYITHIADEYDGDTFMPEFEDHFPNQTIIQETKSFWIVKHAKINSL